MTDTIEKISLWLIGIITSIHCIILKGVCLFSFFVESNVLKTGPVIEPEKLPVHGSLVGPAVEPLLNR